MCSVYTRYVRVINCQSVALTFVTSPGIPDVNAYEVLIGGYDNTMSGIRRELGGDFVYAEDFNGRLSCSFYELFWITWSNGKYGVPTINL